MLFGQKTYIAAILTIIYAIVGMIIGKVDVAIGGALILGSLQVIGLRIGIANNK